MRLTLFALLYSCLLSSHLGRATIPALFLISGFRLVLLLRCVRSRLPVLISALPRLRQFRPWFLFSSEDHRASWLRSGGEMEGASVSTNPRSVDEVFKDYRGRRAGMLRALTSEVDECYRQCDPEKDNLCLYGFSDESWEVNLPADEVPPELPEPALGINFARDGMQRKDWLSLVAVHSDAWLLAVAFYYGARFDKNERKRLFNLINELPTVFDVVTGKKPVKEKPRVNNNSNSGGNKTKSAAKAQRVGDSITPRPVPPPQEEEDTLDDDEEEHGDTFCGSCGGSYTADEFWIGCDICEKWYHGKCVKITPARAEHIKQYKCPACSNKRAPSFS